MRSTTDTVLLERLEELVDYLRDSRELMNAQEAADFLRMPVGKFGRIAPTLPRHAISQRRYVYYRSELLEWVPSR